MSEYSVAERKAYEVGFNLGKSLGKTGVELDLISKKRWATAYRKQIEELTRENEALAEALRGTLAAYKAVRPKPLRIVAIVEGAREALANWEGVKHE